MVQVQEPWSWHPSLPQTLAHQQQAASFAEQYWCFPLESFQELAGSTVQSRKTQAHAVMLMLNNLASAGHIMNDRCRLKVFNYWQSKAHRVTLITHECAIAAAVRC